MLASSQRRDNNAKKEETKSRTMVPCPEDIPCGLWRIRGVDYDLSSFSERHPGGALAIDLLRGLDATNAFNQFHVFNEKHERLLSSFSKKATLSEKKTMHSSSAFHAEVKDMVRRHFKDKSHKASWPHVFLTTCNAVCYVAAFRGWYRGHWVSMAVLPLFAWLQMANVGHDGSHHAVSKRFPIVNELCLLSSSPLLYSYASWYMQHCVSHHLHTNDPKMDADLQHHPFAKWHENAESIKTPSNVIAQFAWHLTAFLLSTLNMSLVHPWKFFIVPFILKKDETFTTFARDDNDAKFKTFKRQGKHAPHELAFFRVAGTLFRSGFFLKHKRRVLFASLAFFSSLAFLVVPFLRFPFLKALAFAILPYLATSLVFMVVTQISHVQADCQRPQDTTFDDFFKRQARTALDYGRSSHLCRFLTGGLNLQSIHHVLPGINSCHYTDLYPKYFDICKRHGCDPPQRHTILHALKDHLSHVASLAGGQRGNNNHIVHVLNNEQKNVVHDNNAPSLLLLKKTD